MANNRSGNSQSNSSGNGQSHSSGEIIPPSTDTKMRANAAANGRRGAVSGPASNGATTGRRGAIAGILDGSEGSLNHGSAAAKR
ncbi:hypothetical protein PG985_004510 [Apiospora marii]|uniref:Uncharacterized protein n=1 Tax=Apiospora marii TaxID=335849 RepID=A0ABR1S9H5_9PEZI